MSTKPVRGREEALAPEINVTPLVDVVLVLLIIFMLVVPQMQRDQAVDLPPVRNVDPETTRVTEPWKVTIVREGKVFFGEEPVETAALAEKLAALRTEDPARRLLLRADSGAPWLVVRTVLAELQKTGFVGASLGVADVGNSKRHNDTEKE